MDIPVTYLSVSSVGESQHRMWRCIHRGMPLCADCSYPDVAVSFYREVTGEKRHGVAVPLWDGDKAELTTWTL